MTGNKLETEEKVEKVYSEGAVSIKKIKPDLRKKEAPLLDVKVTNPITYIKNWWSKIMGNEGLELRIRVKPLTAIAITVIILTITLGIGKIVLPFKVPFFVYTPEEITDPNLDSDGYRNTAFTGVLKKSFLSNRYYLITNSDEAINLEVPVNVDLKDFVGRRIFATGKYHEKTRTLLVIDSSNLELLPEDIEIIPTVEVTNAPKVTIVQETVPADTPEL